MSEPFCILSVDGGGLRGIFPAHLLKRMEEEWLIDWPNVFGLMAGTSTGAILAAGLACGKPAARLTEFYASHGKTVFRPRAMAHFDPLRLLSSRYKSATLRGLLEREFGNIRLGEVPVPLIIPAVDIVNGCVHVFKSKYHDGFVRDPNMLLSDAILASCSAPTYFDPPVVAGKYHLTDGGLWANNPALVAAIDAHYRLGVRLEDLRILSIGTGRSEAFYPRSAGRWKDKFIRSWQGWGLLTRWKGSHLLDLVFNLQSETAHNSLCLLLNESPLEPEQVLRITFESDRPLPMDSNTKINDWIAKSDLTFTHYAPQIARLLPIKGGRK